MGAPLRSTPFNHPTLFTELPRRRVFPETRLPVLPIPGLQRAQKEPGRSNLSLSLLDDPEHSQEDQDQQYEGYNANNICGTTQPFSLL